jgi:hypothetical protein
MEKASDVRATCPYHRACAAVRDSALARTITVAELAALRRARDFVDHCLTRLERDERPPRDQVVRIKVNPGE